MCRKLHSVTAEYTFFSSAHGTFHSSRLSISCTIKQTSDLKALKSYIDHTGIILEINNRKTIGQSTNPWKLTHFLTLHGSKKISQKKLKIHRMGKHITNSISKYVACSKKRKSKRNSAER